MSLTSEDKKWIVETVAEIINGTVPVIINNTVPKIMDDAIDKKIKPLIESAKWDSARFTKAYVDSELVEIKAKLGIE
jgi:hypothetical protein